MDNEIITKAIDKINERLDKMGMAFVDIKNTVNPVQPKRYFVAPHCSDQTNEIDTAHSLALNELKNVERLATANRSTYAKVEHCCEYLNPLLAKFNLSIKQIVKFNEYGEDILVTRLSHNSGQWYESIAILKIEKTGSQSPNQQFGTSVTYMRRYAVMAILGIGQIDDPNDTDR